MTVGIVAAAVEPKFTLINCGSTERINISGIVWLSDESYSLSGTPRNLTIPGLSPTLSTLRSFPYRKSDGPRKFCYRIHIYSNATYLIRATFFYGAPSPPVFDLLLDGTLWTVVNTTADYERDLASYYEIIYRPVRPKTVSLCLAGTDYTEGNLFISSIEMVILDPSAYNATDFESYALGLISRSAFGYAGPMLRLPDDKFNRFWQPFTDGGNSIQTSDNIYASGFWNSPPSKLFKTSLVAKNGNSLQLQWPPVQLPTSSYYISFYFLETSSVNSDKFDIYLNDDIFFKDLNPTLSGISVFSPNWTLSGSSTLRLVSSAESNLPPSINGGEIFRILNVGYTSLTRDITALLEIKKLFENPPSGWEGDPCFPEKYRWTGITCSEGSKDLNPSRGPRVTSMDLSNLGISGSLSIWVSNLTALSDILVGNNSLKGTIPDLTKLKQLKRLHLQDNQFSGELPFSLGEIDSLQELFVQNNNLTGEIPPSLIRDGLVLRTFGNRFSSAPALSPTSSNSTI
ncbi:Leucine-rich repeat protein kinase family protein [Zostera marina]|uniref:Leucine-rich repeat protein kinase family protein n=1 Tax=Zostera marina TaxID=29655 RepID=A0A0K9NJV0_ZOSMR|nr:Leucine-rich repeat protein kinase family protein [Zostera marina]